MPTINTAPQRNSKTDSEVRNVAISFVGKLDSGELLTGTPTITITSATTDLTFANQAVNTAALTINGSTVSIGQAVQFKVSGGTSGTSYTIKASAGTNSTPAQTLNAYCLLDVVSD